MNTTRSDEDKKEEMEGNDGDETDSNEIVASNIVANLKDTLLHDDDSSVSKDDSLYNYRKCLMKNFKVITI